MPRADSTIAFMGEGQVACFEDELHAGFANEDKSCGSYELSSTAPVFGVRLSVSIAEGVFRGLVDESGILALSNAAFGIADACGIALGVGAAVSTGVAAAIFSVVQSAFTISKCISTLRTAVHKLKDRKKRVDPEEVIDEVTPGISSIDDLLASAGEHLDDEALKYLKSERGDSTDDIAQLEKMSDLFKEGQEKVGRKLTKEETKAGLDTFLEEGDVSKALVSMERCWMWLSKSTSYSEYEAICQRSIHNATKDKVMLGKYDGGGPSSYITKAGKDYTYFDLGQEWDAIKLKYGFTDNDLFYLFNEPFLDAGISEGKIFKFSHDLRSDIGALGNEYKYLLKNNYIWDDATMTMFLL